MFNSVLYEMTCLFPNFIAIGLHLNFEQKSMATSTNELPTCSMTTSSTLTGSHNNLE